MKAVIAAQARERVKSTMETIKKNFTARFYGFPTNPSSNKEKVIEDVCSQAIAFIVRLVMWMVIYVKPNEDVFPESMAIQQAITHLQSNAHNQFQVHQSGTNEKITTLPQFVMYILVNYIKIQKMHILKSAILADMPSDYEMHQSLTGSFASNKLVAGVFLDIIELAKKQGYIKPGSQFDNLVISDQEVYWYRYTFLNEKGYIRKFNIELSNQPEDIKNPQNLENLMKAVSLTITNYNVFSGVVS